MKWVKRLQIMIDEDLDAELGYQAAREGVSKAALIRRYVGERLRPVSPPEQDSIWGIVGMVDGGSRRLVSDQRGRVRPSRWRLTFADSSFFIALAVERDRRHADALSLLGAHSGERLITTNHVVGETWTFLRSRYSHAVAVRFLEQIDASARTEVVFLERGSRARPGRGCVDMTNVPIRSSTRRVSRSCGTGESAKPSPSTATSARRASSSFDPESSAS